MQEEHIIPRVEPDQQAADAAGAANVVADVTAPARAPLPGVIRHRPLVYESGPTTIPILRIGGELPISLTYAVQQKKTWGLRKQPAEITLRAEVMGTGITITTAYTVPSDFQVRDELHAVEQTLYDFMGDVLRAEEQRRRATAAEAKVNTLEDLTAHPQMREPYAQAGLLGRDDAHSVSPDTIREFISTLLLLTKVTSLNYEDFIAAQSIGDTQLTQLLDGDSRKMAASLLNNLVGLLEQKIRPKMPVHNLQLFMLEHLQRVNDSTKLISAADAEQIIERLIPAFLKYHDAKRHQPKFPYNFVGHAVSSAVLGYLIAWLGSKILGAATLSHFCTLGLEFVNQACGTHLHYPAVPLVWAVSGAVIFCWPYVQFPFAYLRARGKIARLKGEMLRNLKLTLQPSERHSADLARYAEAFRSKTTPEHAE